MLIRKGTFLPRLSRLRVFGLDGSAAARQDVALADIRAARVDLLVGGGALQVTTGSQTIEVIRFTNSR